MDLKMLYDCIVNGFYYKKGDKIYKVKGECDIYITRTGIVYFVDDKRFFFNMKQYKELWSDRKEDLMNGN